MELKKDDIEKLIKILNNEEKRVRTTRRIYEKYKILPYMEIAYDQLYRVVCQQISDFEYLLKETKK
jgi:hypothetical protein